MIDRQSISQEPTTGSAAVDDTISDPPAIPKAEDEMGEEQRIEESLKVLKEMHIQLRDLRTTIPRLIAPLTTKHPSPEVLFQKFSASASNANQEVQQFRRLMSSEESIKVMEEARKSRAENPNGIKPWKVTEHPDWLKRETK